MKRVAVGGMLVLAGALFVTHRGFWCPIWQAGLPCPSCGVVRAIIHLASGDVGAAFGGNVLIPYWLILGGSVLAGLVGYALGLADDASSVGRRTLNAAPVPAHACMFLVSEIANLCRLGVNPDGWMWRILGSI
jgi:Protein of unknown function (DUF2752)